MRRKRVRATCSFRAIIRTDGTTTLWTCIVYLFFIAICTCNDDAIGTANLNTTTTINRSSSSSSSSGHYVESTTPVYSTVVFTNNSTKDVTESNIFHADSAANLSSQPTTANQERKRTFLPSGNELWDGLIDDCLYKPSFSCFQKNVYTYLDNTLKLENVNVTERIQFRKIDIDPDLLVQLQHSDDEDEMEEDGDNEISKEKNRDFKSESPIEEVTDALYGKWRNFMMTHNVELKMPEMVFDGATFRVTPRGFEGDGAIVKLEMIPNQQALEVRSTGRLFLFKKIKKFFKNKLLLSFLAIVLVIKLIKIKIFWILPLIVGVTAAKKLLLKFILFLFPALSHLFKLCSYYHKNYHDTKYHHHRHQINHLHTVVPAWYNQPHSIPQPHSRPPIHSHPPHGADVIYTSPPKGHPAEYIHGLPNPTHQHYPNSWEHSGPGLGSEYISDVHRNINVNSFKPELESDDSTINSWGLQQPAPSKQPDEFYPNSLHSSMSPSYPDQENSIGRTPVSDSYSAQSNIYGTYETSSQMKYNAPVDKYLIAEKIQNAIRRQPAYAPQVQSIIAADPFYGPIVGRIDSILNQYSAYVEENCKEWLVCNMYKSPAQFSPHSNFLSAELSRDSSELQKPTALNAAVLTFYKYVKAARDGQDQKDCLSINPKCVI